jgi:hypothetical protein
MLGYEKIKKVRGNGLGKLSGLNELNASTQILFKSAIQSHNVRITEVTSYQHCR